MRHVRGAYDGAAAPPRADVVLAFHPGFWGYDSWRATLRGLVAAGPPVVATAYTPQEAALDRRAIGAAALAGDAGGAATADAAAAAAGAADDDSDAEADAAADAAAARLAWLWPPEINPHRSDRVRATPSAPPDHEYRENHVWFGFDPDGIVGA